RHLTVGAAVLEREDAAARTAIEYHWLAAESYAERFSRFDFVRPGDRIPEIGVRIDSAKVDLGAAGSAILHRAGCAPGEVGIQFIRGAAQSKKANAASTAKIDAKGAQSFLVTQL